MSDRDEPVVVEEAPSAERLTIPDDMPVLPLRDTVLFPNSFMPLAVAREASVRLIDEASTSGRMIGVFTQREATVEEPLQDDLYPIGTATHIHKMFKLPDGSLRLIVQGLARVRLDKLLQTSPYLRGAVSLADEVLRDEDHLEIDALQRNIKSNFQQVVSLSPLLSDDLQALAGNITDPGKLADFIASSLTTIGTPVKQEVLETLDIRARMDSLNRLLIKELEVLELGSKIQSQVQSEVGKNQREYFLREQMKAIQKELGEGDEQAKEIDELREKLDAAGMPEAVRKEALRELDRLSKMPVAAAEYTVSRTYLDWIIALPWAKRTEDSIDLKQTKDVLDADHSGLEKVKDRVLEYLAVRKLNPDVKGPILCFLGPPGVGKTSLAKSIANSLGRKFVRVSLGGMRDEAEIRGHRRTYIGALPGQVIQGLRRAESKNPVFILDEIDKLGSDFRGDPASALLEVLDPEQNNTFRDHYLDVPFDLSEVLFLTTANVLDPVPPPLRDRMEVLELAGYTEEEKLKIALEHLVAKQIVNHGLTAEQVEFSDAAIRAVIRGYTREAGVRNLEREIGALCRKVARRRAEGDESQGRHHARSRGRDARRPDVSRRGNREPHQGSRRRRGPGVDARRRRGPLHRSVTDAGRRQPHADRPARRRDEGVRPDGALVVPLARQPLRRRSVVLQGFRDPPARPVGRDPQGRPLGGRHDGDRARVAADRPAGARRHRDDRRDHALGPGAARRRHQGEGPGGAPARHHRSHPAAPEREAHQGRSDRRAAARAHDPLRRFTSRKSSRSRCCPRRRRPTRGCRSTTSSGRRCSSRRSPRVGELQQPEPDDRLHVDDLAAPHHVARLGDA